MLIGLHGSRLKRFCFVHKDVCFGKGINQCCLRVGRSGNECGVFSEEAADHSVILLALLLEELLYKRSRKCLHYKEDK